MAFGTPWTSHYTLKLLQLNAQDGIAPKHFPRKPNETKITTEKEIQPKIPWHENNNTQT